VDECQIPRKAAGMTKQTNLLDELARSLEGFEVLKIVDQWHSRIREILQHLKII
jgi:hypothetical protein